MTMLQKEFYLIIGAVRNYGRYELKTPRIVIGKSSESPKLNAGEVAIRVMLALPQALFQKPALRATVSVPENAVTGPVVDAKVINNIREVIAAEMGIQLTIEQAPKHGNLA